jgi:hypothetical protein
MLLAASRSEAGFARIQQIASARVIARRHDEAIAPRNDLHSRTLLAASRFEGNNDKPRSSFEGNNVEPGSEIEGDVFARRSRRKKK